MYGCDIRVPSLLDLVRFVLFLGVTFLLAWLATTGRVAYTLIMLLIGAALLYAVVHLLDYEVVRQRRED